MFRKPLYRTFRLSLLAAALLLASCAPLLLASCGPLIQPVTKVGAAPTPVESYEMGGEDNPDVYVDLEPFRGALLKALAERDTRLLELWMTGPFLTGTWRADFSDTPPADARKELFDTYLTGSRQDAETPLVLIRGADLKALMGGLDPLSIPRAEAGVVDAFLTGGWGMDGRDEAVLFISRAPDNSLKWHGWMVVKGGFSGARLGGARYYENDGLSFSLFVPQGYEVSVPAGDHISIIAPPIEGAGHPGAVFIDVEDANGRTSEEAAKQTYQEARDLLGQWSRVSIGPVLGIEDAQAFVVNHLPGQDFNRQLFMVHGGVLYRITFTPDDPQENNAISYRQMEDAYAMVVNTFHFTR